MEGRLMHISGNDNTVDFRHIVSFGDSLTDTRNVFNFFDSLGLPFPFQPVEEGFYDDGRFSNGPMWIEYFAEALALEAPTPSTELSILAPEAPVPSPITFDSEGNPIVSPFYNGNTVGASVNFAFGGSSLTGGGPADGDDGPFPIIGQTVEWFINDHQQAGEQIDDDTLITFYVPGIADYDVTEDPVALVNQVVTTLTDLIEDLYANGARDFLISNLPDYRRIPLSLSLPPEGVEGLSAVGNLHNTVLAESLATLQNELQDATIIPVDLHEAVEELIADPEAQGFSEVVQPYFPNFVGTANPDEFLWWDFGNHPTTATHALLADAALEAVNSVIEGTSERDVLRGRGNDDLILARAGNDILKGRKGDDQLFGGDGNDQLKGGIGDDQLFGGDGNDQLKGGIGDDQLFGGDGNDHLRGGLGDDRLYGGEGNDHLKGGKGEDILVGVDPNQPFAGNNEIDWLAGNNGADQFVLGDANQAYYNDGNDSTQGLGDYALITGLSVVAGDTIQLHGKESDYVLGSSPLGLPQGIAIFLNTPLEQELIAIVKGSNNLNLASSTFNFV